MSDVNDFLLASLEGLRATNQLLDTKISFLLVVIFLPFTQLARIYAVINRGIGSEIGWHSVATCAIAVIFALSWVLALLSALRGLLASGNPRLVITDDSKPEKSYFFPSHLFRFSCVDLWINRRVAPETKLDEYVTAVTLEDSEIKEQLAWEQTKLMYIVGLKLRRSKATYWFTIVWIASGGAIWLMELALG
ncbi:hypothetical protein KAX17_18415 [Candidatus Bipolaricaulota bacterium]|nr:hypothetical protein [Candidatus Bipolaricaulota bacterium]